MHRWALVIALLAIASVSTLLLAPHSALSEQIERVRVENFPEVQEVSGEVKVAGPSRSGIFVRREGIVVSPGRRQETTSLIAGGVIETDGYTDLMLSLQGEIRDTVFDAGTVGAVLVPDEEPMLRALREDGRYQLQVEAAAVLEPGVTSLFSSVPTPAPVAFPRYRIFFYNTSNKSAEVNLYLYLTTR